MFRPILVLFCKSKAKTKEEMGEAGCEARGQYTGEGRVSAGQGAIFPTLLTLPDEASFSEGSY